MDDVVGRFARLARRAGDAARSASRAAKAVDDGDARKALAEADKALGALCGIRGIEAAGADLGRMLEDIRTESASRLDGLTATIAREAAATLEAAGLRVHGNLPRLRAGPFTLEMDRSSCTVWFGPKKYKLGTCEMEPGAIAERVLELHDSLFRRDFDTVSFLADLEAAYRVTLARLGLSRGESVPLTMLMAELAFRFQSDAFLSDPRRDNFRPYSRAAFATDLSRLDRWDVGPLELRLQVATMSQTRHPVDHLWVPDRGGMDGTNYSGAAFVTVESRRRRED